MGGWVGTGQKKDTTFRREGNANSFHHANPFSRHFATVPHSSSGEREEGELSQVSMNASDINPKKESRGGRDGTRIDSDQRTFRGEGRDGTGRDGTGRHGTGRDGTGWGCSSLSLSFLLSLSLSLSFFYSGIGPFRCSCSVIEQYTGILPVFSVTQNRPWHEGAHSKASNPDDTNPGQETPRPGESVSQSVRKERGEEESAQEERHK